jgi:predicted PurR-regulated permease PerM
MTSIPQSGEPADVSYPGASNVSRPGHPKPEVKAIACSAFIEEAEILHASLRAGSVAQIVVAIIAIVGLVYLLKFVMVTVLIAMLLAFILEPLVHLLTSIAIPRAAGAFMAVVLAAGLAGGVGYFLCGRLGAFLAELPKDSDRIQRALEHIQAPMSKLERNARSMTTSSISGKQPIPVRIEEEPAFPRIVTDDGAAIGKTVLAIGFIPFLTYFMLTWKEHSHSATVGLFPEEHRATAYRTIAQITAMIRNFIVANLVVGLAAATLFAVVFGLLGIPYFYFLGIISGFVCLVPSFGVVLALVPPLAGGIGTLHPTGVVVVLLTVTATHAVIMNVLYPKLIGQRVRLNPLAVVLSLLFWSWIWGAVGLVLAVPIVGAAKIICDHVDSLRGLGAWLGSESYQKNMPAGSTAVRASVP